MDILTRAVGPIGTNVYVLADSATREAIAIDTATPCLVWLTGQLAERGWRLKMIVSTHGSTSSTVGTTRGPTQS